MTTLTLFLFIVLCYIFYSNSRLIPVPTVTFKSSPTEVLVFCQAKGHLKADCEFIREYILYHTPSNPDDEDPYNSCILGDLEIFCDVAEDKQEQFENEMESAVNNVDHPRHSEALSYYKGV